MRLSKPTRKRIYEAHAKREPVEILWPATAPDPHNGHKYPVKGFASDTRLLIVALRKDKGRYRATVKLDHDPYRLLRGLPAVRRDDGSYETEPEQVDARYQRLLGEEGRLKTVMQGAKRRQRARVTEDEERLANARKKGRKGTVAFLKRKLDHDRRGAA